MTALKTCRNHALQFLGLREFLAYREMALPRPGFFMYLALLETPRPRYFQAAFCTTSSKCEVSIESEVSALPGRQPHGAEVWSVVGAGQAEDDSGRWSGDAWHWTKPRQHETCLQPGSREALLWPCCHQTLWNVFLTRCISVSVQVQPLLSPLFSSFLTDIPFSKNINIGGYLGSTLLSPSCLCHPLRAASTGWLEHFPIEAEIQSAFIGFNQMKIWAECQTQQTLWERWAEGTALLVSLLCAFTVGRDACCQILCFAFSFLTSGGPSRRGDERWPEPSGWDAPTRGRPLSPTAHSLRLAQRSLWLHLLAFCW